MKSNSRIRFNPGTKEIEVEGSESFVKTYFGKLQAMISGAAKEKVKVKRATKAVKAAPAKKAKKKPKVVKAPRVKKAKAPKAVKPTAAKKVKRAGKKAPAKKRVTKIDTVVGLIQGSTEGVSTEVLKEKTGLSERQIWGIVTRAAKEGKIRRLKRGLYGAV